MNSSASDNREYPEFCSLAAADDEVFDTFRQSPVYREILEHFSYENGLHYFREIKNENPSLIGHINTFKTNDLYGGPEIMEYEETGKISPSTIYYIRQLSYLEAYFGDLSGKHIVEVGCGYGGLAKLVIDRFDIASYTVFDLDSVLNLTKKFLGKFGNRYLEKISFCTLGNYTVSKRFDLFISNCAFTECFPRIQDAYMDKVIRHCTSGFIIYNIRPESYHPVVLLTKLEKCGLKKLGSDPLVPRSPTEFILAWNAVKKVQKLPYRRRIIYKISPAVYAVALKFVNQIKRLW